MSTHNHKPANELRYVMDDEPEEEPSIFSCETCGPNRIDWESEEGKALMKQLEEMVREQSGK